jgi:hypothetical protein
MPDLAVVHAVEPIDPPVEVPGSPVERAARIIEAVIRRWPAGAYETRELRRAVALLETGTADSQPETALNVFNIEQVDETGTAEAD